MTETLIPAGRIAAAMRSATTFEGLKSELSRLLDGGRSDPIEVDAQLDSFRSLVIGWDGYSAEVPTADSLALARVILEHAANEDLSPTRLAPSVAGGIGLTFRVNDRKAYVEVTNSGDVSLLLSDGVTDPHAEPVDPTDPRLVRRIREYLGE